MKNVRMSVGWENHLRGAFGVARPKPEGGRVPYDLRRVKKIQANRRRR